MLQLPDIIYSSQRVPIPSVEALCIVLRRLSYPCRWFDLVEEFCHDEAVLSSCFTETIDSLYEKCAEKMTFDARIISLKAENAAQCVHDKISEFNGGKYQGLDRCIGFIDGTLVDLTRPTKHQKQCYNGHHKSHGIKF